MPCAVPWPHSYRSAPLIANGPVSGARQVARRPAAPRGPLRPWSPPF